MDSAVVIIQLSTPIEASDCRSQTTFTYFIYRPKQGVCTAAVIIEVLETHARSHTQPPFVLRFKLALCNFERGCRHCLLGKVLLFYCIFNSALIVIMPLPHNPTAPPLALGLC